MPRKNKGASLNWREERKVWEIRWYEHGSRRTKSTRTADRGQAERQLAEHLLDEEPIGPSDPNERSVTDVLIKYGEEHAPECSDPERIGYCIQALVPFWSNSVVADIREGTCKAYAKSRGVSDGTLRRELGALRAAIKYEYDQGRLTKTVPVWLPQKPDHKDRWLTKAEAAKLLGAARNSAKGRLHLPLFIIIGLYTGARKEAILSLRWTQIDFNRKLIDFNQKGRKRTDKGRPIVPIPRRLMTFLKLARKRGSATGFVVNWQNQPIKDVKKGFHRLACDAGFITEWIKSNKEGPTKEGNLVTWIHPKTDVTPHVLRHTAASWMVQRGVSFPKVARYIGHSNSQITEQVYAHHAPDYLDDAAAAFD